MVNLGLSSVRYKTILRNSATVLLTIVCTIRLQAEGMNQTHCRMYQPDERLLRPLSDERLKDITDIRTLISNVSIHMSLTIDLPPDLAGQINLAESIRNTVELLDMALIPLGWEWKVIHDNLIITKYSDATYNRVRAAITSQKSDNIGGLSARRFIIVDVSSNQCDPSLLKSRIDRIMENVYLLLNPGMTLDEYQNRGERLKNKSGIPFAGIVNSHVPEINQGMSQYDGSFFIVDVPRNLERVERYVNSLRWPMTTENGTDLFYGDHIIGPTLEARRFRVLDSERISAFQDFDRCRKVADIVEDLKYILWADVGSEQALISGRRVMGKKPPPADGKGNEHGCTDNVDVIDTPANLERAADFVRSLYGYYTPIVISGSTTTEGASQRTYMGRSFRITDAIGTDSFSNFPCARKVEFALDVIRSLFESMNDWETDVHAGKIPSTEIEWPDWLYDGTINVIAEDIDVAKVQSYLAAFSDPLQIPDIPPETRKALEKDIGLVAARFEVFDATGAPYPYETIRTRASEIEAQVENEHTDAQATEAIVIKIETIPDVEKEESEWPCNGMITVIGTADDLNMVREFLDK